MAYMTAEQADALQRLRAEYGLESRVSIEDTAEAYGLVWVRWQSGNVQPEPDRNLFIRPNGTRHAWRTF